MQTFNMEININGTSQYAADAVTFAEVNGTNNSSYSGKGDLQSDFLKISVMRFFILVISCMGFLGNGTVIWLLGFRIRRKPFTTYILNLAAYNFALLLSIEYYPDSCYAKFEDVFYSIAASLIAFTYNTGQLLLTAISIDRCVSVLFPIWHRCVRLTQLSATVCALIWVFSGLLSIVLYILKENENVPYNLRKYFQFLLTGLFCLPLMTISTVILFIKVCFKSRPRKWRRLLTVILPTLLFSLILAFPLNAVLLAHSIGDFDPSSGLYYGFLCASLNSSVNPLFYFLVGRRTGDRARESLVVILQRVFNEEENERQELDSPCSHPLGNLS